jgi:hypothetical protein
MSKRAGYTGDFIAAALGVAANTEAVNGTDFDSEEIGIPFDVESGALILTFTRAAGSTSLTVDFHFQISPDNGTTWYDYIEGVSIETGHGVISGTTVRVARSLSLTGATHIRLSKIDNNDTANALTAVNAGISF